MTWQKAGQELEKQGLTTVQENGFDCPYCGETIHDYDWRAYNANFNHYCPHCGNFLIKDKKEELEEDLVVMFLLGDI